MDRVPMELIDYLIKSGRTYDEVSEELIRRYPDSERGLSARNVRRYCSVNSISRLSEHQVEALAAEAIMEVGATYGRRLMKGFLLSKGFRISERNIANALREVDPENYERRRQNTVDRTNPIPYRPWYFGHKIHVDQNEKLASFGVTIVAARDGYSGMIILFGVMPIKNNIAIYDLVYMRALEEYGLWDQVRVDNGREFYLLLHVHEYLRQSYGSANVRPYVQSTSSENMTIERIWPEVNSRVNYPIKRKLISLVESGDLDMDDEIVRFCVSFISCGVVQVGMERFVESWNLHPIPRLGVPSDILRHGNFTASIDHSVIPTVSEAVEMYDGTLQLESNFGRDPIAGRLDLVNLRDDWLSSTNATFSEIFTNIVSGNGDLLQTSINNCINITIRLQTFIN